MFGWSRRFAVCFVICSIYLFVSIVLGTVAAAETFQSDFSIGRTTFLSRLTHGKSALSGIDLGIGPCYFDEKRDHDRTVFDVRTPYNAHYDWQEHFPRWTVSPLLYTGLSGQTAVSFRGAVAFAPEYDRTPDSYAVPAVAGANTTTVDFFNPDGEAKRVDADASAVYVTRLSPSSEVSFGYDFRKHYYMRYWDYRVLKALNGVPQADRQNFFDLGDDLNTHDLWVGFSFLSGSQPQSGFVPRDLAFFRVPGLPAGSAFGKIKGGVGIHQDTKTRRYQFEDSIFIAFSGISVPEFVFQQEEEFSNVPRVIHDEYLQPFVEWEYDSNGSGAFSFRCFGRYDISTSWQREIERFDGPRYAPDGIFEPADVRQYWDDDNTSRRHSWDGTVEVYAALNPIWDAFVSQRIKGRRDGNSSAFSTNWTQGTAPFQTPGRDLWDEDISEDVFETAVGFTYLSGPSAVDRITAFDLQRGGLPAPGQQLIRPLVGLKVVRYQKDFNYVRDNVGPQWIEMGMDYEQVFVGLEYLLGYGAGTFDLKARWDIPAPYDNDASWWWDYGGGDFAPPSDGFFKGTTTSVEVDSCFTYRASESRQYSVKLNYAYSHLTRDYSYGTVLFGGAAPLNWVDRYDLALTGSRFDILFGVELLR